MFFILCFWAVLKYTDSKSKSEQRKWSGVFALAFAGALLTKITISFLPLLFPLVLLFKKDKNVKLNYLFIACAVGIIIAAPWYIFMSLKYGSIFSNALLAPHLFNIVENNSQHLGLLYYLNQLLISNPFILFTFILGGFVLFSNKTIFKEYISDEKYIITVSTIWFFITFLIFSIARTKLAHYSLYMIPPAILLAIKFYHDMREIIESKRLLTILTAIFISLFVWSFFFDLRQDLKLAYSIGHFSTGTIIYICGTIIILIVAYFSPKKIVEYLHKILLACIIILIVRIIFLNISSPPGNSFGAMEIGESLKESRSDSFIYLYHEHNKSASMNPQLDWYTDGWMSGWNIYKYYIPFSMPEFSVDFNKLKMLEQYPDYEVVYYISQDLSISEAMFKELKQTRNLLNIEHRYALFGRKKFVKDGIPL
jgi:hypothetical protein